MLIFIVGLVNGVLQSFGYIPALGLDQLTVRYYLEMFSDPAVWRSIGLSLWIAFASSIIAVIIGTAICFLMVTAKGSESKLVTREPRLTRLIKLPILIPHLIVAVFVISIFSQTGLISRLFFHLGIISAPADFPILLFDKFAIGIILAYLWKEIPFICYFVLTVMAGITDKLEQTAMGLGATRFKAFTNITLPLCRPVIMNSFFIIFAFSFGAFELPYLLGATLPKALPVLAYTEYIHPDLLHRPYAMVLNVVMIVICLIVSILYYRGIKEDKVYE